MSQTEPTLPIVIRRHRRLDGEVEITAIHKRTLAFRLRVWWAEIRRRRHRHRPRRERLGKQEIQILVFAGSICVFGAAAWLLLISLDPNYENSSPVARPSATATSSPSLLVVPLTPRAPRSEQPDVVTSQPVVPETSVRASSSAADTPTLVVTVTTQGTPGDVTQTPSEPPPSSELPTTPSSASATPDASASPSPTPTDTIAGVVLSLLTLTPGANQ